MLCRSIPQLYETEGSIYIYINIYYRIMKSIKQLMIYLPSIHLIRLSHLCRVSHLRMILRMRMRMRVLQED